MNPALKEQGYIVTKNFLDPFVADFLYNILVLRQWRGDYKRDDQVPDAGSHWGDCTLDALLICLLPKVESVSRCFLLPTYSYARLYLNGQSLQRHRDREACEIAVTIHLGHSGGQPPPVRFAPHASIQQQPGDAVIYLGDRIDHWRDAFDGDHFGQLFLNYVHANGNRRKCLYDGRVKAFPPFSQSRKYHP